MGFTVTHFTVCQAGVGVAYGRPAVCVEYLLHLWVWRMDGVEWRAICIVIFVVMKLL